MSVPASSTPGQSPRRFPTTRWSRLVGDPAEDRAARSAAIQGLAELYWKPVYAYLQQRWRLPVDEAADVTQAFFLWVIESDLLDRADPRRGRFRGWLKVTLKHFLFDRQRTANRQKRGGGHTIVSLQNASERAFDIPDDSRRTPDELLDTVWRAEVLQHAVRRLEAELTDEGKERTFSIFRDYFLGSEGELDYARLALRYGCKSSDVSNALMAAKKHYRTVLRRVISETVGNEDELRDEMIWFFGRESS